MKKSITGRTAVICALCCALSLLNFGLAPAEVVISKTDKVTVGIYGQINRAILYANDGDNDEFYHVDNDNSSTRVGLKVKAKPNDKFTVGGNLEFEYQSNASNLVWQEETNTSDEQFDKRIVEVYVESMLGKLTLGHGSTASDNSTEVDLSETKVVTYANVAAFAGGIRFFDDGKDVLSTLKVSDAFNNMDGLSRMDRVRYDTPTFKGFSLAASTVSDDDDDAEDVSLWYKGEIAGIKAAGAVSYVNYSSSDTKKNQVSGSVSFLAPFGLNLTVAAGNREHEASSRDDAYYYLTKVGYIAKLFSFGTTAFAVDYGRFENVKINDDEADTFGVFAVQKLADWNTEIFIGFREYQLDRVTNDYSDIDAVMCGVNIKF